MFAIDKICTCVIIATLATFSVWLTMYSGGISSIFGVHKIKFSQRMILSIVWLITFSCMMVLETKHTDMERYTRLVTRDNVVYEVGVDGVTEISDVSNREHPQQFVIDKEDESIVILMSDILEVAKKDSKRIVMYDSKLGENK